MLCACVNRKSDEVAEFAWGVLVVRGSLSAVSSVSWVYGGVSSLSWVFGDLSSVSWVFGGMSSLSWVFGGVSSRSWVFGGLSFLSWVFGGASSLSWALTSDPTSDVSVIVKARPTASQAFCIGRSGGDQLTGCGG